MSEVAFLKSETPVHMCASVGDESLVDGRACVPTEEQMTIHRTLYADDTSEWVLSTFDAPCEEREIIVIHFCPFCGAKLD